MTKILKYITKIYIGPIYTKHLIIIQFVLRIIDDQIKKEIC